MSKEHTMPTDRNPEDRSLAVRMLVAMADEVLHDGSATACPGCGAGASAPREDLAA